MPTMQQLSHQAAADYYQRDELPASPHTKELDENAVPSDFAI